MSTDLHRLRSNLNMGHQLERLARNTPGIIDVWITELIPDLDDDSGRLLHGSTLTEIGALTHHESAAYSISIDHLSGYVVGLFTAFEAGRYQALDLVCLFNENDNVRVRFDCRLFLKPIYSYA